MVEQVRPAQCQNRADHLRWCSICVLRFRVWGLGLRVLSQSGFGALPRFFFVRRRALCQSWMLQNGAAVVLTRQVDMQILSIRTVRQACSPQRGGVAVPACSMGFRARRRLGLAATDAS